MDFEVAVWRHHYDAVQTLGQYLKDSRPDHDGNPPKFTISEEERKLLEEDIKILTDKSNAYLDKCKMYPKDALWLYNPKHEGTWFSSPKFKYSHLTHKIRKHMTVTV